MEIRISELEDEQVDHLRFDRIKIQRKRMEHILQVIKDLTFKNKELIKQNLQLKQQIEEERQLKRSTENSHVERRILIEKNIALENELHRYKETTLQQELLIHRLQEELSFANRQTYAKEHYFTEPHFAKHIKSQYLTQDQFNASQDGFINSQDFEILKMQYKDLQKQYSKLFQTHYSREKENIDTAGHIYAGKKEEKFKGTQQIIRKAKHSYDFEDIKTIHEIGYLKLKQKYSRVKKQKKELQAMIVELQNQLASSQLREQNLEQIVDVLKDKRTKICLCHINKLEKKLQMKASLLEQTLHQSFPSQRFL